MKIKSKYKTLEVDNNTFVKIENFPSYDIVTSPSFRDATFSTMDNYYKRLKRKERINKLKQCFGNDLKIE